MGSRGASFPAEGKEHPFWFYVCFLENSEKYVETFEFFSWFFVVVGEKDGLYTELWKACAGPLVEVPQANERVYYFPQGHMEQVSVFLSFLVLDR